MYLIVTIKKYPTVCIPFAILSMILFRWPLYRNPEVIFYRLMGSSSYRTIQFRPDWRQWVILHFATTSPVEELKNKSADEINRSLYGTFIAGWIRFFNIKTATLVFASFEGQGSWDEFQVRKSSFSQSVNEPLAVLTRATLRWNKISRFWKSARFLNKFLQQSGGLLFLLGSGEIPLLRNATLSIWENQKAMEAFAFSNPAHIEVINKTRNERWYSEELFLRLKLLSVYGNDDAIKPLQALKLHTQVS